MMMDLKKGRSLVCYKNVERIPGISLNYIRRHLQASTLVAVNSSPISSSTRTKNK